MYLRQRQLIAIAAEGTSAGPTEYRDVPYVGARNIVWIVAQLHLLLQATGERNLKHNLQQISSQEGLEFAVLQLMSERDKGSRQGT